jgi:hypothetical protein
MERKSRGWLQLYCFQSMLHDSKASSEFLKRSSRGLMGNQPSRIPSSGYGKVALNQSTYGEPHVPVPPDPSPPPVASEPPAPGLPPLSPEPPAPSGRAPPMSPEPSGLSNFAWCLSNHTQPPSLWSVSRSFGQYHWGFLRWPGTDTKGRSQSVWKRSSFPRHRFRNSLRFRRQSSGFLSGAWASGPGSRLIFAASVSSQPAAEGPGTNGAVAHDSHVNGFRSQYGSNAPLERGNSRINDVGQARDSPSRSN